MHLCRCNSGSLPCYSFWLSFARYDHAVNGSGQCRMVQVPFTTHFASLFRIIIGEGHISDLQNAIIEQGV